MSYGQDNLGKRRAYWREYAAKKRKERPEEVKEEQRKYREANRERLKEYYRNWRASDHGQEVRKRHYAKLRKTSYETILFKNAKKRASTKGWAFDLEVSDIVIPSHCPVLGIPIQSTGNTRGKSGSSPSLDRVDNTKGYTKDNVRVISYRANVLKRDASIEEVRAILAYMEAELNDQKST